MLFRLDYLSCVLTVLSTVLVGRRKWHGWVLAGANSAIISLIGLRTGQWGFVPANVFCIAIYLYNIKKWRTVSNDSVESQKGGSSARLSQHRPEQAKPVQRIACRIGGKHAGDERAISYRIRARRVPNQRESRTPF